MDKLFKLARLSSSKYDNKKNDYQIHDSISFEEVDDASNYKLTELPLKLLYETNKLSKEQKSQRLFLTRMKDHPTDKAIRIHVFDVKDLFGSINRKTGYYNIAALQILVKFLGNAGIDIPIKVSIRDLRIRGKQESIIGLWSSNLYSGAVYIELTVDMTLSVNDANIEDCLVIDVFADIDMEPGSKAIAVVTQLYASYTPNPNPFRTRDGQYGMNKLKEGKTVYIKPSDMDVVNIPQPIPIEDLNYDLEFEFTDYVKPKPRVSNTVKYAVETSKGLHVKLESPRKPSRTKSSRFPAMSTSKLFEDLDDEY